MEDVIRIGLALTLVAIHSPFLLAFFRRSRERTTPEILHFAVLGIVIYYDSGFVLQSFGWSYHSPFFPSLESLTTEQFAVVGIVLMVAPYVLAIGYRATAGEFSPIPHLPTVSLVPKLRPIFFLLFVPLCAAFALVGFSVIYGVSSVVDVKLFWMSVLGSGYIAFLLPMFVLAFFLRTKESRSPWGWVFIVFLLAANVAATLFLGQRTMTLLPFLMVVIFLWRVSAARLALSAVVLFAFASAALWFYKGFAVDPNENFVARVQKVVNNDIVRSTVLARAIDESDPIGTRVLPNPGQGYLYTLLLYVPRSVLPQKGYSTAAYFTAFANGEDTEFLAWGLGLGFLEEISLNFGYVALVPGILLYGAFLGLMQRVSQVFPSCVVGTHLGAVWMSGYGSPSVFLYFGSMTLFAIVLEGCFADSAGLPERSVRSQTDKFDTHCEAPSTEMSTLSPNWR